MPVVAATGGVSSLGGCGIASGMSSGRSPSVTSNNGSVSTVVGVPS